MAFPDTDTAALPQRRQAGRQAQMTVVYEEKNLTECVFMGGERKGVGQGRANVFSQSNIHIQSISSKQPGKQPLLCSDSLQDKCVHTVSKQHIRRQGANESKRKQKAYCD
jgi:hypothetical protein